MDFNEYIYNAQVNLENVIECGQWQTAGGYLERYRIAIEENKHLITNEQKKYHNELYENYRHLIKQYELVYRGKN